MKLKAGGPTLRRGLGKEIKKGAAEITSRQHSSPANFLAASPAAGLCVGDLAG